MYNVLSQINYFWVLEIGKTKIHYPYKMIIPKDINKIECVQNGWLCIFTTAILCPILYRLFLSAPYVYGHNCGVCRFLSIMSSAWSMS